MGTRRRHDMKARTSRRPPSHNGHNQSWCKPGAKVFDKFDRKEKTVRRVHSVNNSVSLKGMNWNVDIVSRLVPIAYSRWTGQAVKDKAKRIILKVHRKIQNKNIYPKSVEMHAIVKSLERTWRNLDSLEIKTKKYLTKRRRPIKRRVYGSSYSNNSKYNLKRFAS